MSRRSPNGPEHQIVYFNRGIYASTGGGTIFNNYVHRNTLEELEKHCSHSAAFDSATRFAPPRCLESTRARVIHIIQEWVSSNDRDTPSFFWLYGGAGVGKSALGQTLSEAFHHQKQLAASFFFFRGDNNGDYLIPTLASQLIDSFEGMAPFVEDSIRKNRAVFAMDYQTQIRELLVKPLIGLKSTNSVFRSPPRLIVIDGLDECTNSRAQVQFLQAIARAIPQIPYPFRFLIISRPEEHITRVFDQDPDLQAVHRYNLSNDPDAYLDIRTFLETEFSEIRQVHPLGRHLPDSWPNPSAITFIAERSNGHFIDASTMIRFIRSPKHRPDERLEVILRRLPYRSDMDKQKLFVQFMDIVDVLASVETISHAIPPLRVAILGFVDAMITGADDPWQGDQSDVVNVTAALTALTWILQKYQAAKVALPGMVAKYARNLTDLLNSRLVATQDGDETATLIMPHIASAFLIESSNDAQSEAEGDRPFQNALFVTDFNGRRAYAPLELCASWLDLCLFLEFFLRGDKESQFIATRKFGVRIPDQVDLLSGPTWDSWIGQGGGAPYTAIDLYAIIHDDSNSCPACKMVNPVQYPLPFPGNFQQCQSCQFLFLESYQDGTGSEEPGSDSVNLGTRSLSEDAPMRLDSVEYQPGFSSPTRAILSPETQTSVQGSKTKVVTPSTTTSTDNGPSVPKHIQVVRRRKPYDPEDEHAQALRMGHAQPIPLPEQDGASDPTLALLDLVKTCRALYNFILFHLPGRYHRNALSVISEPPTSDNERSIHRPSWGTFHNDFKVDVTYFGTAASILFGVLLTALQTSSAANSPIIRSVMQLSITCLFFGLIYSLILWVTVGKLKSEVDGISWINDNIHLTQSNTFWNLWVMLSMPLVWILWGFIYFACFLVALLWHSDTTDKLDEKSLYGPRAITILVLVIGLVYLGLIIYTTKRIL